MNKYIKIIASFSVLLIAACSGPSASTDNAKSNDGPEIVSGIFYDDDGENCVVFVSDEGAASADESAAKSIIWSRLKEDEFEVCDESRPNFAGLYSIVGLDEYEQPDWSSSTEHHFFKIKGWSKLKKLCADEDLTEDCSAKLETIFIDGK